MVDIQKIVSEFCSQHALQIKLSTDMPAGYETANGTFDITKNTLYFNAAMLAKAPDYAVVFYLFHELRHALQYTCPQTFRAVIRRSLDYVLMYDGTCYKLVNGEWAECKLEGTAQALSDAYLGQPYELDANDYAYEQAKRLYGPSKELDELYAFWIPRMKLSDAEYLKIYEKIDRQLAIG